MYQYVTFLKCCFVCLTLAKATGAIFPAPPSATVPIKKGRPVQKCKKKFKKKKRNFSHSTVLTDEDPRAIVIDLRSVRHNGRYHDNDYKQDTLGKGEERDYAAQNIRTKHNDAREQKDERRYERIRVLHVNAKQHGVRLRRRQPVAN